MYIRVINIKMIFEDKYDGPPIGAEVDYEVLLGGLTNISTLAVTNGTGKMIILNPSDKHINEWSMWDFQRHIHETIMKSIR